MRDFKNFTEAYCACLFSDSNILLESHGYAVSTLDKEAVAKESWDLFEIIYEYCGGYKSYMSVSDMVKTAEFIKFVYNGSLPDIKNFKIEKCLALLTFNHKAGLKATSGAGNFVCFPRNMVIAAVKKLESEALKYSWFEVSDKAEKFLIKYCNAMKYVIPPEIIKKVYASVTPEEDGLHYTRKLSDTGDLVKKIAFGTIHI